MRTIKLAIMIGGAASLLSSTGPSLAQSADIDADLRCVVLAGLINAANKDPDVKRGAQIMGAYFVGKLNGRDPSLNVKSAIEKTSSRTNFNQIMEQDAERCIKAVETFNKQVL
jgi:adenine-specific DNA methylase